MPVEEDKQLLVRHMPTVNNAKKTSNDVDDGDGDGDDGGDGDGDGGDDGDCYGDGDGGGSEYFKRLAYPAIAMT